MRSLPSQMLQLREQIVEWAIAQVDKPYAEHGWGPRSFDCIGFFSQGGIQNGVLDYDFQKEEDPILRGYTSDAQPNVMLRALKKYTVKVDRHNPLLGDGFLFRAPKAQHLGIIVRLNPCYVIHASMAAMKVKHERIRNIFYVSSCWRYPGLIDG